MRLMLFGALGALLPDVLRLIKGRYEAQFPAYLGSAPFWLGLLLNIALGVAVERMATAASEVQALACGFSAPEMLTRLLAKAEPRAPQAGPGATPSALTSRRWSIRDWWSL